MGREMLQELQDILTEHYRDLQRKKALLLSLMEHMSSGPVVPITRKGYRGVHISTAMTEHTDSTETTLVGSGG